MTLPCNNIFVHRLKKEFFRLLKLGKIFNGKRNGNALRCGDQFSINGLMVDIYHKFTDQGCWNGNRFSYTSSFGPTSVDGSAPQCAYAIFCTNSHPDIKSFLFSCENAALSVCRDFFEKIEDFKPINSGYNTELATSNVILLNGEVSPRLKTFLITGQKDATDKHLEVIYKSYKSSTEDGACAQFRQDSSVKGYRIIRISEKREMSSLF